MSDERLDVRATTPALRPERRDCGARSKIFAQEWDEFSASDMGSGNEGRCDTDAAARGYDGGHRIAHIGDDAGIRQDLQLAIVDHEGPAECLTRTLKTE